MNGRTRSTHAWGPTNGSWTTGKARAHATYCKTHKVKLSYEEYRERVKASEEARKQKTAERMKAKAVKGSRSALKLPPAEIAAKILEKVK